MTTKRAPDNLNARARRLWAALGEDSDTPRGAIALEVCRTVTRLDELDRIIAGRGVLDLMRFRLEGRWWDGDDTVTVEVKFAAPLSEARQQAGRLSQLLEQLGLDAGGSAGGSSGPTKGESPLAAVLRLAVEQADDDAGADPEAGAG